MYVSESVAHILYLEYLLSFVIIVDLIILPLC